MYRIFRHYIPGSLLVLGICEAIILYASVYVGVSLRFWDSESSLADVGLIWPRALVFTIVMLGAMTVTGLYKNHFRDGIAGMLWRLGLSIVLGLAVMSAFFYAFPQLFLGRGAFGIGFGFAAATIIIARLVLFAVVGQEALKRRVVVLGAGERAAQFKELRRKTDRQGFVITGFIHVPGEHDVMPANRILHLETSLVQYVRDNRIDEIVIAVEDRRKSFPVDELLDCKMSGVNVVDILTFFERQTGKIRLDTLHPSSLIYSDGFRQGVWHEAFKRLFDVGASLVILAITWPIMVLTALAIWFESGCRGPILYRQVRVGQNWRLFQVTKFRSMRVDAEKDGKARWATKNDARVTRVGHFIRKTRIDELPQLFNVLRGDMSFVGPRPERPEFVEQLAEKIPYYAERHRVKPGITGWAQIRYAYGDSERDAVEKLQYDLYYVKNYSLFLDFLILFQTAEVVLFGRGAR